MRLLYAYLDFTKGGEKPEGYRGYKKVELNFDTRYRYRMEKDENRQYTLHRETPENWESLPESFWSEDGSLFNVTALVGDNGVGKTTLLHELIDDINRCISNAQNLVHSFHGYLSENKGEMSFWAGSDFSLVHFTGFGSNNPCVKKFFSASDKHFSITKLLYFSNTLSQRDSRRFCTNNRESLYNCSLPGIFQEAVLTSYPQNKLNDIQRPLPEYFSTYFNFRSYQEARFLFDRNQWQLMQEMKKEGFPVPAPRELNIRIENSLERIYQGLLKQPPVSVHEELPKSLNLRLVDIDWKGNYSQLILRNGKNVESVEVNPPQAMVFRIELCINTILNVIFSIEKRNLQIYDECFNSFVKSYAQKFWGFSEDEQAPLLSWFLEKSDKNKEVWLKGKTDFINTDLRTIDKDYFLTEIGRIKNFCTETTYTPDNELLSLIENSETYIRFLFNNYLTFANKCDPSRFLLDVCFLPLGETIDPVLSEYMIRFLNLTRAVSNEHYFVTYNWGLSSGESNLLHMFTKLRYLLDGVAFTSESPELITEKTAEQALKKQMRCGEKVRNDFERINYGSKNPKKHIHTTCDSLILFLDEADLTYHPEWQRQFVAILTRYLPRLFAPAGIKDIQVIMATHSPLMLGDFPAGNVIYLKKNEVTNEIEVEQPYDRSTFGENLYTILRDGFYLKNGTVGELARRKINAAFDFAADIQAGAAALRQTDTLVEADDKPTGALQNLQNRWDVNSPTHYATMHQLAQGILRSKLEEELETCRNLLNRQNPESPAQRKARLLAQIARLQKEADAIEEAPHD